MNSLNKIKIVRERLNNLLAEKRIAERSLIKYKKRLKTKEKDYKEMEDIQSLFQSAVSLMYSSLSSKLGSIITEGMAIVFPEEGYIFCIDFVERRNNVEADIYLKDKDGERYHPVNDVGGGIADFTSLLLRIVYIILSKYDNILICDEPLKFVDRERIPEAVKFIHKLSEDFKFQILMNTHIPEFTKESELIYYVKKVKGVSKVKIIDTI